MRYIPSVSSIAFALMLLISSLSLAGNNSQDDKKIERLHSLYKQIRCLTCGGENIYESRSEFALDVRNLVLSMMNEGKTDQEIFDSLKTKYGRAIVPGSKNILVICWILIFLIASFTAIRTYKKHFKHWQK